MIFVIKFSKFTCWVTISRKYYRSLFLYLFSGVKLRLSFAIIYLYLLIWVLCIPKSINYLGGAYVCVKYVIIKCWCYFGYTHIFYARFFIFTSLFVGKKLGWD